mmetsp:Transcript_23049/g.35658  ORF Transcript_23049/g.35658 Transcript_23049/m.35658 type:complete len:138 (-) Transcript_23049:217-630(-)
MLVITVAWCTVVMNVEPLEEFVKESMGAMFGAVGVLILVGIAMNWFYSKCRSFPMNYFLLFLYAVAQAYLISCMLPLYKTKIVLIAAISTLIMFLWLTLYSVIFAADFTVGKGFCFTSFIMLFYYGIVNYFVEDISL